LLNCLPAGRQVTLLFFMHNKIKTIFAGTPEFAVPYLQALLADSHFNIIGILTQPDKPSGRKQELTPSPIKTLGLQNNIRIFQPESLKNNRQLIDEMAALTPDLLIVVAYGQIIPQAILDISKYGNINVHPSLLPLYRGASPIQSAILNGEQETGVTIMLMDEKMDHGPILNQIKYPLTGEETNESLHQELAKIGVPLLLQTITDFLGGQLTPIEQDHNQATFCKSISKEDAKIDWSQPAKIIRRKIYAFYPWPATWTSYNGKRLKIFPPVEIKKLTNQENNSSRVGAASIQDNSLLILCGEDSLIIKRLQLEGKKEMLAEDFIRGNREINGAVLN